MSRRDEEREFENDVFYEAWRRGLNPDRAVECASDCYWNDRTPEQCVDGYQSKIRQHREHMRQEQEFLEEQERMHYEQQE